MLCVGLNLKRLPQAQTFEHLVSLMILFGGVQVVQPCQKCVTGYTVSPNFNFPLCFMLLDKNVISQVSVPAAMTPCHDGPLWLWNCTLLWDAIPIEMQINVYSSQIRNQQQTKVEISLKLNLLHVLCPESPNDHQEIKSDAKSKNLFIVVS